MHKQPNQSQILTNIKAGSKLLQIKMSLRYGKLLDGIKQPNLDDFSTACMVEILKKYNPGLALMHLTAYDSLCHKHGRYSDELETAYKSLDNNLARLLEAVGGDRDVIIFSDHSQLNVHTSINPNDMLVESGLLHFKENSYIMSENACFFECCGGSAFFHSGNLSQSKIGEIRDSVSGSEGFKRFLTDEEMRLSGQRSAFGFGAKSGYCYESFPSNHKATHGYTLDMPDYSVFYMFRFKDGENSDNKLLGNSLLDITSLAAERLGLGEL
jgi:predicted AlkP superfamily pyrophosphatase or phosphodiesterase